ncbi:hypothetical protein [Dactylosporangium sp. CA-233914]|uniref:hypothetical protein n=1 Tax=Dactylosporangium sp. CA-233914 TaxID=3239934 RepID=UPI003D928A9A
MDELAAALSVGNAELAAALSGGAWSSFVNPGPLLTDVGRPQLIEELSVNLPFPNATPQVPVCILSGLSGIGKSSVAAAWAADRLDEYGAVIWIDATSVATLEGSFAVLDRWLAGELPDDSDRSRSAHLDLFGRVAAGLGSLKYPWLIVFDNATNPREVRKWFPRTGIGHAVVTTTNPIGWTGPHARLIPVPPMTLDQASELLSKRLRGAGAESNSIRDLRDLAERLARWPLALELAAAYLNDCYEGSLGGSDYPSLIMRSLDDEEAIPPEYPRTLVAAVLFAFARMEERARNQEGSAFRLAFNCTWFAAFFRSRQIPLHILLSCSILEPHDVLEKNIPPLTPYAGTDPPVGEVLRAMRRESLVTTDVAIFDNPSGENGPAWVGYTVSMNEIVQMVLRREALTRQNTEPLLSIAAFFAQYWLSSLVDAKRLDLALALVGHCCQVADQAQAASLKNYPLALLWGNTAAVLAAVEEWRIAERYLRLEMDYIASNQPEDRYIELATGVQLATVLVRSAATSSDVVEEVVCLLEASMAIIDEIGPSDDGRASSYCIKIAALTQELSQDCPANMAVRSLRNRAKFVGDSEALQNSDDAAAAEVMRLHEMVRSGDFVNAKRLAQRLRVQPEYDFHYVTLTRLVIECSLHLGEWREAERQLRDVASLVDKKTVSSVDISHLIGNLGMICFGRHSGQHARAYAVLRAVVGIAATHLANGGQLRPSDQARLLVYQACIFASEANFSGAQRMIESVSPDLLLADEKHRVARVHDVYQLIRRWLDTLPKQLRNSRNGRGASGGGDGFE